MMSINDMVDHVLSDIDYSTDLPEQKRIQRKRSKGWKMPKHTVYVGRPTKWGNPHYLNTPYSKLDAYSRSSAIEAYKVYLENNLPLRLAIKEELKGKDLACWCPLDKPCHADVLLELANN